MESSMTGGSFTALHGRLGFERKRERRRRSQGREMLRVIAEVILIVSSATPNNKWPVVCPSTVAY